MYMRLAHAESSIPALRQLIKENPFGILTTGIASPNQSFLQSTHLPFLLDLEDDTSETELGVLRGHLARQNPQSKSIIASLQGTKPGSGTEPNPNPSAFLQHEVLVLFTAASHHYITTKFYKETKPTTGKVVPTWNYAAVQAYGKAKIFYDSRSDETTRFLTTQLHDLSEMCERGIMGYTGQDGKEKPWTMAEAPEEFTSLLIKNIIGIEITIEKLEGKFKMSQELGKRDVEGVLEGLATINGDAAKGVSDMVKCKNARKLQDS